MTYPTIVGFSGNLARPSKTRAFVRHVAGAVAPDDSQTPEIYDIEDLGVSLAAARSVLQLDERARSIVARIIEADVLVVGSPTYKGSYTGLFKHLFDLLDPASLRGKPVVLTATGGGDRHALMVEHQLRPLFGFFEAFALPTAIYASERDLDGGVSDALARRIAQSRAEVERALQRSPAIDFAPPPRPETISLA